MYIYHISGNGCQHMKSLIPSIRAVYRLKEEFHPYVQVRFLPHRENQKSGIVLKSGDFFVRKDYTFHDPKQYNEVRNIVWDQLKLEGKIVNNDKLAQSQNNNKVIQGWGNAVKNYIDNIPDNIILPTVSDEIMKSNILHEVYKLNQVDYITLYDCTKIVKSECYDHFPVGTYIYNKCLEKGHERCSCIFKFTNILELLQKIKKDICKRLKSQNIPCHEKKLDIILNINLLRKLSKEIDKDQYNYDKILKYLENIVYNKLHVKNYDEEEIPYQMTKMTKMTEMTQPTVEGFSNSFPIQKVNLSLLLLVVVIILIVYFSLSRV